MDFENDQYRMPAMVKVADEYETHGGELKIFPYIIGNYSIFFQGKTLILLLKTYDLEKCYSCHFFEWFGSTNNFL